MGAFLALSRCIDRINETIGKIVGYAIFLSILISAGNAIVRKVTPNLSSNMWLELQWYLFGAAFLLAAAYVLKQNEHIRIDLLYGTFRRKRQHWIDLFGHLVFLLPFCLLMLYYLGPYALRSIRSGELSANAGGLPLWPAKVLLLVGFALLTLQAISEIIKKIAVMRGLIEDPHPFISAQEAAALEAEALIEEIGK